MNPTEMLQQREENYELASANRKLTTVVMGMTLLMGLVACLSYLAGRAVTQMKTAEVAGVVTPAPQVAVVVPTPTTATVVNPAATAVNPVAASIPSSEMPTASGQAVSPVMAVAAVPVTPMGVAAGQNGAENGQVAPGSRAATGSMGQSGTGFANQVVNSAAPIAAAVPVTAVNAGGATNLAKAVPAAPTPISYEKPSPYGSEAGRGEALRNVGARSAAKAAEPTSAGGVFLQVGVIDPGRAESFTAPLKAKGYRVQLQPVGAGLRVLVGPMATEAERISTQYSLSQDGFPSFPKKL